MAAGAPSPRTCTSVTGGLWSIGPSLVQGRSWATATALRDGRVALVGGSGDDRTVGPDVGPLRSAELWDPATTRVTSLPPLAGPRVEHTATLLRDGRLAVVGGGRDAGRTACAERIELLARSAGGWTWTEGPALRTPRYAHAAALLSDGRLMVVGGASSLETGDGRRVVDTLPADLPEGSRNEVLSMVDALDWLRGVKDVSWTFFSPAASIEPGERTGRFRLGGDQIVRDAKGESRISMEDYAVALLDEIERPKFVNRRFTIGY